MGPEHIIIEDDNELKGMIPNFRKFNSNGEYVFDHVFVNTHNQLGKQYFPKYLSATPFTPVRRKKLYLWRKKIDLDILSKLIFKFLLKKKIPSFHINFIEKNISDELKNYNFFPKVRYSILLVQ